MAKKHKLNYMQKREVDRRLQDVCHSDPDGFSVFDEGLDDHKFAAIMSEELGVAMTYNTVAHLRRSIFGNFRTVEGGIHKLKTSNTSELVSRVAGVEADLVKLTETLTMVIDSQEAFNEMNGNFRRVMAGHGQKIEAIRKVVAANGDKKMEAIYRAKDRLGDLLGRSPWEEDGLFKNMRGEGFQDGVTHSALVLLGAVIEEGIVSGPDGPPPRPKVIEGGGNAA